jgi:hypothetical protein
MFWEEVVRRTSRMLFGVYRDLYQKVTLSSLAAVKVICNIG